MPNFVGKISAFEHLKVDFGPRRVAAVISRLEYLVPVLNYLEGISPVASLKVDFFNSLSC